MAGRTFLLALVSALLAVNLTSAKVEFDTGPLRKSTCYGSLYWYTHHAQRLITPYGLTNNRFRPFSRAAFIDNPCRTTRPFLRRGMKKSFARRSRTVSAPVATAARRESAPQAGVDFSTTNVQVAGVDEPDIVKTDGRRVFIVRGKDFFVVRVNKDGTRGSVAGRLTLPTYAREMLFEGNDILVIGQDYGQLKPRIVGGAPPPPRRFLPASVPITVVYKIRILRTNKPRLLTTLRMEGRYISSREVNGMARIIIVTDVRSRLRFERKCDTAAQAIQRHRVTIANTSPQSWLPRFQLFGRCSPRRRCRGPLILPSCSNIYLPRRFFSGWNLVTVVPLSLRGRLYPYGAVSISAEGDKVYSTATSLYVTSSRYRYDLPNSFLQSRYTTSIHKFAYRPRSRLASLAGSGSVTGSVS